MRKFKPGAAGQEARMLSTVLSAPPPSCIIFYFLVDFYSLSLSHYLSLVFIIILPVFFFKLYLLMLHSFLLHSICTSLNTSMRTKEREIQREDKQLQKTKKEAERSHDSFSQDFTTDREREIQLSNRGRN